MCVADVCIIAFTCFVWVLVYICYSVDFEVMGAYFVGFGGVYVILLLLLNCWVWLIGRL